MNAIFLLDKPSGISSNHALQRVKRLFQAKKAGHTGTLDPLASGMLPICLGEATKFSQYLLGCDKTYFVTMRLGERTTTSDSEGEITATRAVKNFSSTEIDAAFDAFRGDILQIPTMFSAIKFQGRPLYEYARQGITVERKARPISIFNITVLAVRDQEVDFSVHCSTGTYVRTLVDDVGEALGCGAHVTVLRRLSVGKFCEKEMVTLAQLEQAEDQSTLLLPMDSAVDSFPIVTLSEADKLLLQQGKRLFVNQAPLGLTRLYAEKTGFFGMGEVLEDGELRAKRLVSLSVIIRLRGG